MRDYQALVPGPCRAAAYYLVYIPEHRMQYSAIQESVHTKKEEMNAWLPLNSVDIVVI